ncbi:hypothetical protein EV121DRAFT_296539 [Schizophyllum commune]
MASAGNFDPAVREAGGSSDESVREDLQAERDRIAEYSFHGPSLFNWSPVAELSAASERMIHRTIQDFKRWHAENNVSGLSADWKEPGEDMPEVIWRFLTTPLRVDEDAVATALQRPYIVVQKRRSAITYFFGVVCELGSDEWHEDQDTGRMRGNPSISPFLSKRLLELRSSEQQRKRTLRVLPITSADMKLLHRHNAWKAEDFEEGHHMRYFAKALHCAYTLAFYAVLRWYELRMIKREEIRYNDNGSVVVVVPCRPFGL